MQGEGGASHYGGFFKVNNIIWTKILYQGENNLNEKLHTEYPMTYNMKLHMYTLVKHAVFQKSAK